ncbi:MAG: Crp/Fnr family transcriptional regulator [Rubrivivax sp.]|nr:Crp/Fnr family transcriptional regulator [Rubrivivax sp.]
MLNTATAVAPAFTTTPVIATVVLAAPARAPAPARFRAAPKVDRAQVARTAEVPAALAGYAGPAADLLDMLGDTLALQRRVVHAGDVVYRGGERFGCLYILNSGFLKIVNQSADGREQVIGFKFRGDWLGFDGIARGHYAYDALAMDTGEVLAVPYAALMAACIDQPGLLTVLHQAMSREIAPERDSLMSVCTLPSDARVADFLCYWAAALAQRGLRTDQFTLRMTRAEIGNYLGMTLETVSRALSRLARDNVIAFTEKGRRDLSVPDVKALAAFVERCLEPARTLQ